MGNLVISVYIIVLLCTIIKISIFLICILTINSNKNKLSLKIKLVLTVQNCISLKTVQILNVKTATLYVNTHMCSFNILVLRIFVDNI